MSSSTHARTISYAMGANAVIAVAKLAAGIVSHSSALLAESAHSVADTVNQVFLRISLSLGSRPADERHPFGYGKERFFWAFLAAVFIFVSGAVFSMVEGVYALLHGREEGGGPLVAYVVLAISFVAEGVSWARAVQQLRGEAAQAGRPMLRHIRLSRDPTVKTVLFEDSAALAGIVLAALGVALHQLTGERLWDAAASIAIGVLLALVALRLGRDSKGLLLGVGADPEERETIRASIAAHGEIRDVTELLTMYLGPESLLVTARVDLRDDLDADDIEALADRIDRDLREAVPGVTEVFIDPTPAPERARGAGGPGEPAGEQV